MKLRTKFDTNNIGPSTKKVIATLLARFEIQEQSYGSCMGILRLADRYSQIQLEFACRRACQMGVAGYQQIKTFIEAETTTQQSRPANCHANLRGGQYYSNDLRTNHEPNGRTQTDWDVERLQKHC